MTPLFIELLLEEHGVTSSRGTAETKEVASSSQPGVDADTAESSVCQQGLDFPAFLDFVLAWEKSVKPSRREILFFLCWITAAGAS